MNQSLSGLLFGAILLSAGAGSPVVAQTADDYNEGSHLEYDATNEIYRFKWWGRTGRTYFLQHSEDLRSWSWVPLIESGDDSIKEWGLTTSADKFFLRLWHTDLPTTDPENEDFDGDGVPSLFEVENGFNPLASTDSGENGMPDEWEFYNAGKFAIWPPALSAILQRDQTAGRTIYLRNDTADPVNYAITLENNLAPSYSYEDSTAGSTAYLWDEISTTGTLLTTISNADDGNQPISLTQFSFPFYGSTFSQVFVSSNGLVTVGAGSSARNNLSLPSASAPANLIAPFWDDLDTRTIGDIYYKEESDRLIIQFENVGRYGGGTASKYTFQAILYSDGRIKFQYKSMVGVQNSATIGIQNSTRNLGIQVAHNAAYVGNEMAVEITPQSSFLSVVPSEGTVSAFATLSVDALFQSLQIPDGTYTATISASHTAPSMTSPHTMQATLEVINTPGTITMISPTSGMEILEGGSITLNAIASDSDRISKVEFYSGTTKIGESFPEYFTRIWYDPPSGTHTLTAHLIDTYGGVTISGPVTLIVIADSDGDFMPDAYETANGLDPLIDDAELDLDGDGLSNLWEFQNGFNPADPADAQLDSDTNGLFDWWEITHFGDVGVNPLADPDKDNLNNLFELQIGTNPNLFDTDADGLPDDFEHHSIHLDPLIWNDQYADSDGDQISDLMEAIYGLNPDADDSEGDIDGDGLNNEQEIAFGSSPLDADLDGDQLNDLEEFQNQTNPWLRDSDGDTLPDGWEVRYGFNPKVYTNFAGDPDNDGLSLAMEYRYGTHPNLSDTDGDGTPDGQEVTNNTDAKDPGWGGSPPAAPSAVTATTNPDGSVTYTWQDNSTNENGFRIRAKQSDESWMIVGETPANTNTLTTPAP